jgi:tetratricopeptide (TPR) repeat protein
MKSLRARNFTWLEAAQPRLTYMFIHNIIQEVVYRTLLEEQQRELHQAVGEALESLQPEAVERLAFHYRHSGVRDKTLLYLDKAARKTQREYANETALNYYGRALALEERWEWRKGQVEVLHILGRRDEEQVGLRALAAISEAPIFEVAYLWGQYYEAIGEYPQAQAAVEQALNAFRDESSVDGQARCLAQLGLIARRQGNYDGAKGWYDQALALSRDQDVYSDGEAQALAQALSGLGTVHRQQGSFDRARASYERALHLSRIGGDRRAEARVLHNLGSIGFYQRHFTEAQAYYQKALEIRRGIGDRAGEEESLYSLAQIIRNMGDYGQAQKYFLEALAISQAVGDRWEEVNVLNELGITYQELGELSNAQDCLQRGLSLSQEIGDEAGQAYILANLGPVARDQGDLEAAEDLLTNGLALAQTQDDRYMVSYFLSHLGVVDLRAGRLDQAIARAQAALSMRREIDLQLWTTADLTTLGAAHLAAGDLAQALDCAQQALAILNECGGEGPEIPQQDYFICYQILMAVEEEEAAHAALQSAHDLVVARADKIIDPTLRQSFLGQVTVNREIMQEYKDVVHET